MEKGYSVFMKNCVLLLKEKQERLVAWVEMGKYRMYKLSLRSVREKCLWVDVEDKASLWHLHFYHLNHDGLKELVKKNMVHGLSNIDYDGKFCEEFLIGKHAWTLFQKKAKYRAKHSLEIFIPIYVDQSPLNLLAVKDILFHLLMISHEKLGFIFWKKKPMHLRCSKCSKLWWRRQR